MKLLVRIKEKIEMVYITIVFISVLVGFVVAVILAHVIWVLARKWALSILTAKTVIWALTQEWVLARDNTVCIFTIHSSLDAYCLVHLFGLTS